MLKWFATNELAYSLPTFRGVIQNAHKLAYFVQSRGGTLEFIVSCLHYIFPFVEFYTPKEV